jgi:uncharacterized protein (DUF1501 family)
MNTSRRTFLKGLAAGAGLGLAGPAAYLGLRQLPLPGARSQEPGAGISASVPPSPQATTSPAPDSRPPAPAAKALVVIQLAGGNDGLATVMPFADPAFKDNRPTLTFADDQLIKLNDHLALHPNLKALKPMWDNKKLAVVQGVGYPNPNRSHFASMDIWATASPDKPASAGWLGRYLDAASLPVDNAFNAVSVGPALPFALKSQKAMVASVADANNFQLRTNPRHREDAPELMAAFTSLYQRGPDGVPYYGLVERVESTAAKATQAVKDLAGKYHASVTYPGTPLGRGLQSIAQILSGGFGTRVYYVSTGGFDTHANEKNTHDRLMTELGDGISAFYNDIKAHGLSQNVVMMTWSEFGRRVKENGSNGTDHGTAAPMFVLGDPVKGGIVGDHPSLTKLDGNGDLVFGVDFRSVYNTVLGKWLGMDGQEVLGGKFETLPLFA